MTQTVVESTSGPRVDISRADDYVRATVRALMAAVGIKTLALAEALGMSDETLRRKLRATGTDRAFTAGEVARVAAYFGKLPGDLYDGLGGQITPPPVVMHSTQLGGANLLTVAYGGPALFKRPAGAPFQHMRAQTPLFLRVAA